MSKFQQEYNKAEQRAQAEAREAAVGAQVALPEGSVPDDGDVDLPVDDQGVPIAVPGVDTVADAGIRTDQAVSDVQSEGSVGTGAGDIASVDTGAEGEVQGELSPAEDLREQAIQNTLRRGQGQDENGNLIPHTYETAAAEVDSELAAQEGRGQRSDVDYSREGFQDLPNQLTKKGYSKDDIDNVILTGEKLGEHLGDTINPIISSPDLNSSVEGQENIAKVVKSLQSLGAIDNNTLSVKPELGNALSLSIMEVMLDEANKRDRLAATDEVDLDTVDADDYDPFGAIGEVSDIGAINTANVRGNLFEKVASKLVPPAPGASPDAPQARPNYQYKNPLIENEAAPAVDALLWQAVKDAGLLTEFTDGDGKTYVRFNDKGEKFFNSSRPILNDIVDPQALIHPGKTPSYRGETIGKERERKSAKDVSIKSKVDRDSEGAQKISDAKGHLGAMPLRVKPGLFRYAQGIVLAAEQQMAEQIEKQKQNLQEDPEAPLQGLFIDGFIGETLGIDEAAFRKLHAKSYETLSRARDRSNGQFQFDDNMVINDANAKIRKALKARSAEIKQATETKGIFYNKWFHAASNGRLHTLNNVLNGQDSKLVRGFVGSARPATFKVGDGSRVEENWKYIVAHNLAPNAANKTRADLLRDFDGVQAKYLDTGKRLLAAVKNGLVDEIPGILEEVEDASDKGEWSFKVGALMDLARHDAAGPNGSFSPEAQTEHDGKQNGIAIQIMQSGRQELMKNIGVIYDDQANAINQQDIRELMWDNKDNVIELMFSDDKDILGSWQDFFNEGGVVSNQKEMLKQPVMETSYGKDALFHIQSATDFLNANPNGLSKLLSSNGGPYESLPQAADALNGIIGNTIKNTLNLRHQEILKEVALFYAALGRDLKFRGPLGNWIYLGNKEFRASGDPLVIMDRLGREITAQLGKVKATGQGAKPVTKFKDKDNKFTKESLSFLGQVAQNQMPVLSIQNIDSAIMVNTINEINDGKTHPDFMLPIHDAIITDANTVDMYHKAINDQFIKTNIEYNLATAIKEAVESDFAATMKSIDNRESYPIGPTAERYRAIWGFFNMHNKFIESAKARGNTPSPNSVAIVKAGRTLHPTILEENPEPIRGARLKGLFEEMFIRQGSPVDTPRHGAGSLTEWEADINRSKGDFANQPNIRSTQYN